MFTYQVRQRALRTDGQPLPTFPCPGSVRFHLAPAQPFGAEAGGGHTAVRAVPATAHFNANNGQHWIQSHVPLKPLEVLISEPSRTLEVRGAILEIRQTFSTLREVGDLVDGIYFVIPTLLAVAFADPPTVERVSGTLGSTPFRWELHEWQGRYLTTTQEQQEQAVATAWTRLSLFSNGSNRRLLAALHYFHVACRLSRLGATAGEFLPEVPLNLAKVLEAIFPAKGSTESIDAARSGLRGLGIGDDSIESDFVPAIALRNHVHVGHVGLALFNFEQLAVIHAYAEAAEGPFRSLLASVTDRVAAGTLVMDPHDPEPARGPALKVVERMQARKAGRAA